MPEILYSGRRPIDLAGEALDQKASKAREGRKISDKAALADVFSRLGVELVKRTLNPLSGGGAIAEDINSLVMSLDSEGRKRLFLGIGGICLGAIIKSLEEAAVIGWSDQDFFEKYDFAITGTQLPKLDREVFSKDMISRRSPQEQAQLIRAELARDGGTFLFAFDPARRVTLPEVLDRMIHRNSSFGQALALVLPFYRDAVKALPK